MMVHNQLSGYVHEVPDQLMGPALGEVVYDGLGNPVGWNPFDTISQAVQGAGNLVGNVVRGAGNAVGNIAQGAGNIIGSAVQAPFNLIGSGINAAGQAVNAAGQAIGGLLPGLPGLPGLPMPPGLPIPPGMPFPPSGFPYPAQGGSMYPPRWPPYGGPFHHPLGWIRPSSNLPYTGLGPQRMYMRCAVWPGPKGLVPGPGMMPPGMQPGMPGAGGGHRHHRRRRR
jgi:hypothetical protein